MKQKDLETLFEKEKALSLEWPGFCHDCQCETKVIAAKSEDGLSVTGGAIYSTNLQGETSYFIKCEKCYEKDPTLRNFQPTEVYTRCIGYIRPVGQMNGAKIAEVGMRVPYTIDETIAA